MLVVCLLLSLVYHVALPESRLVLAPLTAKLASNALAGDLEIGAFEELSPTRVVATSVVVRDPQGRVIIRAQRVTAWPDLDALLHGSIRVAAGHIEDAEVILYTTGEDDLEVSLVQAFQAASPGDPNGPPGPRILLDGLRLDRVLVHGDVPRYPGVRVEDVHALGRIDIHDGVRIQVFELTGNMTGPYEGSTRIEHVVLDLQTADPENFLEVWAHATRDEGDVRARVHIAQPLDPQSGDPLTLEVEAQVAPLAMETLASMEIPGTSELRGDVNGYLRLEGPADDLALHAWLETEGGAVELHGTLPTDERPFAFSARTAGLDLERLVVRAPPLHLEGEASIEIPRGEAALREDGSRAPLPVRVQVAPLTVAGVAIPALEAEADILEDSLEIRRVYAPHLGGTIEAHGRVGFDGSVDVEADVRLGDLARDPNVASAVPGLHGAPAGRIRVTRDASGELGLSGRFVLHDFRYGPVRVRRLGVDASLRGDMSRPTLRAQLDGQGTFVSALDFGNFDASASGSRGSYHVRWRSRGEHVRSLALEVDARARGDAWILTAPAVGLDMGSGPMHGEIVEVAIRRGEVSITGVDIRGRHTQLLTADGVVRPRGSSELRVSIDGFPMERIADIVGERLPALGGMAQAHLSLRGPIDRPAISVHGAIEDLTFDRARDADLEYQLDFADDRLSVNIHGDLGTRGAIDLVGGVDVTWADLTDATRLRERAGLELNLYASHVNLDFLTPLMGQAVEDLGVSGRFTGDVAVRGTPAHPEVRPAIVILDRLTWPGWAPMRVKTEVTMAEGRLEVARLWMADEHGELVLAEGSVAFDLESVAGGLPAILEGIYGAPWSVGLRIAPRSLSDLPRPIARALPSGVQLGGSATLRGGDGEAARGEVMASLEWTAPATPSACAESIRPVVQLAGTVREGSTHLDVRAFVDGLPVAAALVEADTPIDQWLRSGSPTLPMPAVGIRVQSLPLERLPWTCGRASGVADADIRIQNLLSEAPTIEALIDFRHLRLASTDTPSTHDHAYRVALALRTEEAADPYLGFCAAIGAEDSAATPISSCGSAPLPQDGETVLRGAIPLRFTAGSPVPAFDTERALDLTMLMAEAHLEPVLALLPQIADADVIADGRVLAHGTWEEIELTGGLSLRSGEVRLVSVGQQLQGIRGTLAFQGTRIVVSPSSPIVVRDGDGRASMTGEVRFAGLIPTGATLRVEADEFPARREGAVMATITGEAETGVSIETDGLEATVTTSALTVRVPEQLAGSVQDVAPLREVLVVGEEAPTLLEELTSAYPIHIFLDATRPFWVRRNDFAVEISTELHVLYADPDLFIGGQATILRGYFEVFGKRFDLSRGSLTFPDGSPQLNPIVDVQAVYAIPGRPGATITVTVTGSLDHLAVDFSSTETSDDGEIIAMLVSGRRSIDAASGSGATQQAGEQAANFVAGLTAGILTLGLRQQFGDVVPVIAIETGDTLGDTRIRAGFDANALIPDAIRDVVTGIYVEGFLTTSSRAQGSSGQGGVGGGVTLEVQFPYNLVGSGTYVPPQAWGVDFTWEP